MNRAKAKRNGVKRTNSMPPRNRNISNVKVRKRSISSSVKRRRSSVAAKRQNSINVPSLLPIIQTNTKPIALPTSKMSVIVTAIMGNLQDLRTLLWQRLCTMLMSMDSGTESFHGECRLAFIEAYIRITSNLEVNLSELNRDYLKRLIERRRPEDDKMFLEITQELFRLQRLFSVASKTGRVSVSSLGRAKEPGTGVKGSNNTSKTFLINTNPLADVAVRDLEALVEMLETFFHGESDLVDSIPDHCFWMRRNILLRCSAQDHSLKKPQAALSSVSS